jgi:hypothetical protein
MREVRVYWKDAEGQGHDDRCQLSEIPDKVAEIIEAKGTLVSVSSPRTGRAPQSA